MSPGTGGAKSLLGMSPATAETESKHMNANPATNPFICFFLKIWVCKTPCNTGIRQHPGIPCKALDEWLISAHRCRRSFSDIEGSNTHEDNLAKVANVLPYGK